MKTKNSALAFYGFVAVLMAVLLFGFAMIAPYILSVFMGGVLSMLCYPLYWRLINRNWGEKLTALLVTLGLILVVIGPVTIFSVKAAQQATSIGKKISQQEQLSFDVVTDRIVHLPIVESLYEDEAEFREQVRTLGQNLVKQFSGITLAVATYIPHLLLQVTLACIACFFFLMDGRDFIEWAGARVPIQPDIRTTLSESFQNSAISVIWATLAAAASQAGLMMLSFFALGIPAVFLAGGATFFFAWIPMVGSVPVWVSGAVYLYANSSVEKALVMVVLGLITGVVDNFVRPFVLKGRNDMHLLVSLVAIFGGIQMFGILGVFVGPILAAVLTSLLESWPRVEAQHEANIKNSDGY